MKQSGKAAKAVIAPSFSNSANHECIPSSQAQSKSDRFQEQRCVRGLGEVKEIWSAQDTLVLKALVIVLHEMMQPHPV
jgi:hypothetical protein